MPTPPEIHIGEVLGLEPRLVAPGTPFTMLKLDASGVLQVDDTQPFINQPPLAIKRSDYISQLLDNKIVVVNDGSHLGDGYPDEWGRAGHPLRLIIKRKQFFLTITALDQVKSTDITFVFDNTDYTVVGLQPGDTIVSVDLTSAGAPAGSPPGEYDIIPSNAIIDPSSSQDDYEISYVNGTMTVSFCPWGLDSSVPVRYELHYDESTNPFNKVAANTVSDRTWSLNSTLSTTETSGNIGDPFGRGSSGQASAIVTVTKISANTIRIRATLLSMGKPMEILIDPVTQDRFMTCDDFNAGGQAFISWTANWFGGFPIGLVMFYSITFKRGP